jgi:hypothetical protein
MHAAASIAARGNLTNGDAASGEIPWYEEESARPSPPDEARVEEDIRFSSPYGSTADEAGSCEFVEA